MFPPIPRRTRDPTRRCAWFPMRRIKRAFQRPLSLAYDRDARPAGAPPAQPIPMYSQLRVIGQIFAGYIALEAKTGCS